MKDKEKQIEEIYNLLFCDKWEQPFTECPEDIKCMDCIAKKLYEQGYRKIDKNSVVLSTEHIKKIKQIIDNICEAELGQVHASSKDGKVTKTVDTSLIAKNIYEHLTKNIVINIPTIQTYSTHDNDMIVLSREEFKEKIKQVKDLEKNYYKKVVIPQERKETAEKILNELLMWRHFVHHDGQREYMVYWFRIKEVIKELFSVEIKE